MFQLSGVHYSQESDDSFGEDSGDDAGDATGKHFQEEACGRAFVSFARGVCPWNYLKTTIAYFYKPEYGNFRDPAR